jgi:hypothetical protein
MLTGSTLRGNLLSAYSWDNAATGIMVAGAISLVLAFLQLRRSHLLLTEA